jgi:hypothetical protein
LEVGLRLFLGLGGVVEGVGVSVILLSIFLIAFGGLSFWKGNLGEIKLYKLVWALKKKRFLKTQ